MNGTASALTTAYNGDVGDFYPNTTSNTYWVTSPSHYCVCSSQKSLKELLAEVRARLQEETDTKKEAESLIAELQAFLKAT